MITQLDRVRPAAAGPLVGEPTSARSLLGAYQDQMIRRHGRAPRLDELVEAAWAARSCDDDQRRDALVAGLKRTLVGYSGPSGGFLLPIGLGDSVLDRARMTDGCWARCSWMPVTTREWWYPVVNESSRTQAGRWGGFTSTWGLDETHVPPPVDGKVGRISFVQNRLLLYTVISADLFADSERARKWLDEMAIAELRYNIEWAMIHGPGTSTGSVVCPQGAIGAPSTIAVAKGSGQAAGTITAANIDAMWAAIYGPCKSMATWHANDATMQAIDGLATAGQWSESIYMPQGAYGNPYPLLKGRPLLMTECCPDLGTPGDLICADWSQYIMTYKKARPDESPLSFNFAAPPADGFHRGAFGLPDDAVGGRLTFEKFYDSDEVAFLWKFRGDGHWIWSGTMTDGSGNTVSPCSVIAQR
jgi:HK97 family phage major capsid protein